MINSRSCLYECSTQSMFVLCWNMLKSWRVNGFLGELKTPCNSNPFWVGTKTKGKLQRVENPQQLTAPGQRSLHLTGTGIEETLWNTNPNCWGSHGQRAFAAIPTLQGHNIRYHEYSWTCMNSESIPRNHEALYATCMPAVESLCVCRLHASVVIVATSIRSKQAQSCRSCSCILGT